MSHDHDHPSFLAHHFETPQQQFDSGKLGMWLFLATEVLLFGGLFVGYWALRTSRPELFEYGSHFLDTKMGAINTCVLILSSLTMAAAVTVAQRNNPKTQDKRPLLLLLLGLTLAGAAGFMVIKYFEYSHKFHMGVFPGTKLYERPVHADHLTSWDDSLNAQVTTLTPLDTIAGADAIPVLPLNDEAATELEANKASVAPPATADGSFNPEALETAEHERGHLGHSADYGYGGGSDPLHPAMSQERPTDPHLFFNIYFMMTGLHGIHVVLGAGVILWIMIRTARGEFSSEYFTPIDLGGLYWHVVDLIWIFLFPMFYLIH